MGERHEYPVSSILLSARKLFLRGLCWRLLAVVCLSFSSANGASVLERLQGMWMSDREGSVAASKANGRLSHERIDKLAHLWGRMLFEFNGDKATVRVSGRTEKFRVRALSEEDNAAVFEFVREVDLQPCHVVPEYKYFRVELHGGHYWATFEESPAVIERFVRVLAQVPEKVPTPAVPEMPAALCPADTAVEK